MKFRLFVLGLLLIGCPGSSAPNRGGEVPAPQATAQDEPVGQPAKALRPVPLASAAEPASGPARADGAACSTGAECASGACEGEGCEPDQGRCAPKTRNCTRDLRMYCGCDGKSFGASGSCPGRTYRHRSKCGTPPG